MLPLQFPQAELYDERNGTFYMSEARTVKLEHCLAAIAKWEGIWTKPFISRKPKTVEEMMSYIECMCIDEDGFPPDLLMRITPEQFKMVNDYIELPMTATTISNKSGEIDRRIKTAELIYYYMLQANVPFECQYWPFNRLITLLQICAIENGPKKKMSMEEIYRQNDKLNRQRKAKNKKR